MRYDHQEQATEALKQETINWYQSEIYGYVCFGFGYFHAFSIYYYAG